MKRNDVLQEIFDNWGPLKRSMHTYFADHFGTLQMSPVQFGILKTVSFMQPISHKALAQKLQLTPGGLSQQLEGLEDLDLISRTTDPEDRRVVYLSLSPVGQQKIEQFHTVSKRLLQDAFAKLSDEELAAYLSAQRKLIEHLDINQHKHKEN